MTNKINTKNLLRSSVHFAFGLVVMAAVSSVNAKTDVGGKVRQLKDNHDASRENLAQYEANLKTVNLNIETTERALKSLEKQKQAVARQTADSSKGKQSVDAARKQLEGYMAVETNRLSNERKQIEELRRTLAVLEENAQKREKNIAQYREKIAKVDSELGSWSERNQSIVELEKAIREKEQQAQSDRKLLLEKKVKYEAEVAKWKREARVAERQYQNYSSLKD